MTMPSPPIVKEVGAIFWFLLLVNSCACITIRGVSVSAVGPNDEPDRPPLCNADGIGREIRRAIVLLKIKEQIEAPLSHYGSAGGGGQRPTVNIPGTTGPRQGDDDDADVPYYVPALAKVIGSVLSQNATSIVEESFGFIPPEVNKNIQYVLGLVAQTVDRLKPPTPTTTQNPLSNPQSASVSPISENSNPNATQLDAVSTAALESVLALALAQQIGAQLAANDSSYSPLAFPSFSAAVKNVESPVPTTTTTFKYSSGSGTGLHSNLQGSDAFVYAPEYAPNYVETTTFDVPLYAPDFGHGAYTPSPKSTEVPPSSTASPLPTSTGEDEEEDPDDVSTLAPVPVTGATGGEAQLAPSTAGTTPIPAVSITTNPNAPALPPTTTEEDDDYEEDSRRRDQAS